MVRHDMLRRWSGDGGLDLLPDMVPNLAADLRDELHEVGNGTYDGSNRSMPGSAK